MKDNDIFFSGLDALSESPNVIQDYILDIFQRMNKEMGGGKKFRVNMFVRDAARTLGFILGF